MAVSFLILVGRSSGAISSRSELKSDVERAHKARDPSYCGSCYGASAPESG